MISFLGQEKGPASHIYRSIVDTQSVISKGLKWVIGDGKSVDIWKDWWCGETPLALLFPGNYTNSNAKVVELIEHGRWNLDMLFPLVDQGVIDSISRIKLPLTLNVPDHPTWAGSPSGNFSVAAAYNLINKDEAGVKSLEAELYGSYRGLTIILEKSLANVTIESDSLVVVELINEGNPGNHNRSIIITEAHGLLNSTGTKLSHTYCNANQCADHLAHLGAEQNDELTIAVTTPISLREFLIKDSLLLRQALD
ncbi:hypothetical protein RHMOL_Rhmol06G0103100 [Rhododendron molle]|uniref:Uncharacterized protein n=1 Tax=Rhododendron molle TaxID=49168 RepID=A0ACC0NCF0_RHOML|nr:hypothetical protein RHMOL_Rhmol06G0103100 [Rhododendron molle]